MARRPVLGRAAGRVAGAPGGAPGTGEGTVASGAGRRENRMFHRMGAARPIELGGIPHMWSSSIGLHPEFPIELEGIPHMWSSSIGRHPHRRVAPRRVLVFAPVRGRPGDVDPGIRGKDRLDRPVFTVPPEPDNPAACAAAPASQAATNASSRRPGGRSSSVPPRQRRDGLERISCIPRILPHEARATSSITRTSGGAQVRTGTSTPPIPRDTISVVPSTS